MTPEIFRCPDGHIHVSDGKVQLVFGNIDNLAVFLDWCQEFVQRNRARVPEAFEKAFKERESD